MWTAIIVGIILYIFVHQLDKRIRALEEVRGPGYSHSFWIDATQAFSRNKHFRELVGIKTSSSEKEYDEWTKEEQDKWGKYPQKFMNRLKVRIAYLASENSYYIYSIGEQPRIIQRDTLGTSGILYSAIIAGDEDGYKPHIEFEIYERLLQDGKTYGEWVLTFCIQYTEGFMKHEKNKFQILCDFPHLKEKKAEDLKNAGFEVDRDGGGDIYEDSFGEMRAIPTVVTYKKNGVEIRYIY